MHYQMVDELYEAQCAVCHGEFGGGGKGYPQLAGGNQDKDENGIVKTLKNQRLEPGMDAPKRTVGTYWPVATTLFTYIRDSMPYAHPKSLSNDEVYAITAYILAQNDIEIDGEEMDDENAKGFYPNIDGPNAQEDIRAFFADRAKNIGSGTRCMKDCKDPGMDGKTEATLMKIGYEMKDVVPPYAYAKDLPEMKDVVPPYAYAKDLPPEKEGGSVSKAEKMYDASCKLCHATDTMGAPAVGDANTWESVMKKGMDTVLVNAIKGLGGMPPKGGNMDLSDDDIKEIVEFMINSSKKH
jgi:cytochrome c